MDISLWLGTCCTGQLTRKIRDCAIVYNAWLKPSCQVTSSTLRVLWFALLFSVLSACSNPVLGAAPEASGGNPGENVSLCDKIDIRSTFTSLDIAIEKAEAALAEEKCSKHAFLIYLARTVDDGDGWVHGGMMYIGSGRGGAVPIALKVGEAIVLRVSLRRSQAVELRIQSKGYQQTKRRGILYSGKITVWDDIVLRAMTPETAASLVGRIWLEGEEDTDGMVILVNGNHAAIVDEDGYFSAEQIDTGRMPVSSYKRGYHGMRTDITAKPGEEVACELRGYRDRYALVRWEFQPDGSRDFSYGTVSGEAILSPRRLDRVSFAQEFGQVGGFSDFRVRQEQKKMIVYNFDIRGKGGPGFKRLKAASLDDVSEAPEHGYLYPSPQRALRPGDVFVFRCYDGKHYGKFEVLDLTVEPPPPDYGD